MFKNS